MRPDFLWRLPPPTALLIANIFTIPLAHAHVFPRQTTTLEHRPLSVVDWPPLPTAPPFSPAALIDLRRRQDDNTVCGFIGGDPELPATCSAGSHCVLDNEHGVIGCCPNGQATCTTGVFTGCVDVNSPPQTEVNPYVYTCQGSNVCYKNVFEGGLSQFGCGTASSLATTVEAAPSGAKTTDSIPSVSVPLTATAKSLSVPTTIDASARTSKSSSSSGSGSSSSSSLKISSSSTSSTSSKSSSSSSSSSSSKSSTSSTTLTTTTMSTTTTSSDPVLESSSPNPTTSHTGAIIGGTISGVAILVALVAIAIFFCLRRRRGNVRNGPGASGNTQYISPMAGGPQGFARLHSGEEGYESGVHPGEPLGTSNDIAGGGALYNYQYPPGMAYSDAQPIPMQQHPQQHQYGYQYGVPYQSTYAGEPPEMGVASAGDGDRVPLTREIDDFSRGFQTALDRIGEEDEFEPGVTGADHVTGHGLGGGVGTGMTAAAPVESAVIQGDEERPRTGSRGGERPLWQQNRQQSRNMMWM